MKYAHIDTDNYILGWYTPEIHSTIPTPKVGVEDRTWTLALQHHHNHITSGGVTSFVDLRTEDDLMAEVRGERDYCLEKEVDPIVTNPLRWADITPEKQNEWVDYRTALLDLTDQDGFPYNVTWPTTPE